MPPATVLGQKRDQPARAFHVYGVEDAPFPSPRAQQAGALQQAEMVRQGGRRHRHPLGDFAGRQAAWSLANEQAEHREAVLVGEGGEGTYGAGRFHTSHILEIWNHVKGREGWRRWRWCCAVARGAGMIAARPAMGRAAPPPAGASGPWGVTMPKVRRHHLAPRHRAAGRRLRPTPAALSAFSRAPADRRAAVGATMRPAP